MTLKITSNDIGTRVRARCGAVGEITAFNENLSYPVAVKYEDICELYRFTVYGQYWLNGRSDHDIFELLPPCPFPYGQRFITKDNPSDTYACPVVADVLADAEGLVVKDYVSTKSTNPKDRVGVAKVPRTTIPAPVLAEVGLAMLEGARKYGRYNWRNEGVLYSVYHDATIRHMDACWEGENLDPDSGLSHITKAIATLVVLRDSMIRGNMVDDRPPGTSGFIKACNEKAAKIIAMYPDAKDPIIGNGTSREYQG